MVDGLCPTRLVSKIRQSFVSHRRRLLDFPRGAVVEVAVSGGADWLVYGVFGEVLVSAAEFGGAAGSGVFVGASGEAGVFGVLGDLGEDVCHAGHAFACGFDVDLWVCFVGSRGSFVGFMAVFATVLHGYRVLVIDGQASSFWSSRRLTAISTHSTAFSP